MITNELNYVIGKQVLQIENHLLFHIIETFKTSYHIIPKQNL